ncbi:MAG: type IV pilus modification PilV family protein [Hyphomicrobium sp.]
MTKRGEAGFTLLETIVAFVVLALVASGLQLCLSGGWRSVRLVGQEEVALGIARAELAAAGIVEPLASGSSEGTTEDGYTWTREVRPLEPADERPGGAGALTGFWVDVTVSWREGPFRPLRSIALGTLKLGRGE